MLFVSQRALDRKVLSLTVLFNKSHWCLHIISCFLTVCKEGTETHRMICFVTARVSVLSPELNLAHRMMSALPPFVPSSSQRVTNEQCIKDSQLYLQELGRLALWALKSEYLLVGSRVTKWKSPFCVLPAIAHEASILKEFRVCLSTSFISLKCHQVL
jgi:hypothetical protein